VFKSNKRNEKFKNKIILQEFLNLSKSSIVWIIFRSQNYKLLKWIL
jgi:hypothetical protein